MKSEDVHAGCASVSCEWVEKIVRCVQAGGQAECDQGQAWVSRRARQARRVHGAGIRYPGTFLTCPWKVWSNVVGSACLPRLASCKYFLSPSGFKYHQAEVWYGAVRLPITEVPNHAIYCPCPTYISRGLAMSRSPGLVLKYLQCSHHQIYSVYALSTGVD